MTDKEFLLLQLYYIERRNEWKVISNKENNQSIDVLKKTYKNIDGYISNKLGISIFELKKMKSKLKKEINEIEYVFRKFNKKRKDGFKSFECFLKWYQDQKQECYYCNTSAETLQKLFNEHNGVFKPKKDAWKYGTLQIERKDPGEGYIPTNCVLACVLCNNAKSDLITHDDFMKFFKDPIKNYIAEMSNKLSATTG